MQKGFSLVELLVSMFVIGVLSVIGVQSFISTRIRAQFQEDLVNITSVIREVQNTALAPSKETITSGLDDNRLCYVGVILNGDTIQKFYRTFNDAGTNCELSQKFYGQQIKLDHVTFENPVDFEFSIPFATTPISTRVEIESNNDSVIKKEITVTSYGLIRIN